MRAFDVVIQIGTDVGPHACVSDRIVSGHVLGNAGKRLARNGHVGSINPATMDGARDSISKHRGAGSFFP